MRTTFDEPSAARIAAMVRSVEAMQGLGPWSRPTDALPWLDLNVVRVSGPIIGGTTTYPGFVQVFDDGSQTWSDADACIVSEANGKFLAQKLYLARPIGSTSGKPLYSAGLADLQNGPALQVLTNVCPVKTGGVVSAIFYEYASVRLPYGTTAPYPTCRGTTGCCTATGSCGGCDTLPETLTFNIGGLTNGVCTSCNNFNGTVVLARTTGSTPRQCQWLSPVTYNCAQACPCHWEVFYDPSGNMWRLLFAGSVPTNHPYGSGVMASWQIPGAQFTCNGQNIFGTLITANISSGGGAPGLVCNNLPATITVYGCSIGNTAPCGAGACCGASQCTQACTQCNTLPLKFRLTVAGVTGGTCASCAPANGTFTMSWYGGSSFSPCCWVSNSVSICGTAYAWYLVYSSGQWILQFGLAPPAGTPSPIAVYNVATSFNCGGSTVFNLMTSQPTCGTWPAALRVDMGAQCGQGTCCTGGLPSTLHATLVNVSGCDCLDGAVVPLQFQRCYQNTPTGVAGTQCLWSGKLARGGCSLGINFWCGPGQVVPPATQYQCQSSPCPLYELDFCCSYAFPGDIGATFSQLGYCADTCVCQPLSVHFPVAFGYPTTNCCSGPNRTFGVTVTV